MPSQTWASWSLRCVRALGLALLLTSGCGAEADPGDSSTHFWATCGAAAECGPNYDCICGRCTKPCNEAGHCQDENAACVSATSLTCAVAGNVCADVSAQPASEAGAPALAPASDGDSDDVDSSGAPMPNPQNTSPSATSDAAASGAHVDAGADVSSATEASNDADASVTLTPDTVGTEQDAAAALPLTDAGETAPAAWSAALPIEQTQGSATFPKVTVDAQGHAVAVWIDSSMADTGNVYRVLAAPFAANSDASEPVPLFASEAFLGPLCLSGNDDGAAVAVWAMDNFGSGTLWAATLTPAGWSEATVLGPELGSVAFSDCAMDEQGNAVAAWTQYDGQNYLLQTNRLLATTGWQGSELVSDSELDAYQLSVAQRDGGEAHVVWNTYADETAAMWASAYSETGWQAPQPLLTTAGVTLQDLDLALNSFGEGILAWNEFNTEGTHDEVWVRSYSEPGGWGPALSLLAGSERTSAVAVGIDDSGAATVVWEAFAQVGESHQNNARFSRRTALGAWSTGDLLAEDVAQVRLVVHHSGATVAAWRSPYAYEVEGDIRTAVFSVDTGWNSPQTLSGSSAGDAVGPWLDLGAQSNAAVVWQHAGTPQQYDVLGSQLHATEN